jgi:TRAP-type C4-dicarboxylate transport system substrate-binding protein
MGMNEIYDAFSTNTINAAIAVPEAYVGFSLYEVTDFAVEFPYNNGLVMINMNKDKFNSLPEDLQQIILDSADKLYQDKMVGWYDKMYYDYLDEAKGKNTKLEVNKFSQADLDKMTDILLPSVAAYAEQLNKDGYDGTGMLEWMNTTTDKFNAEN